MKKEEPLYFEIKELIQAAKKRTATTINSELTILYWKIGKRISVEILKGERAEYGKYVIEKLSKELMMAFGKGWSKRNLAQMIKFSECFPDFQIVQALTAQLSWTHFTALISIDIALKREFYITLSIQERWSTRTLSERINSQLYERTAISKKPEITIRKELEIIRESGQVNQEMFFKDPYILDFLELNDTYLEKDLEDAILRELQHFLLELDKSGIHVAEYLTSLPSKEVLEEKLHQAIINAKQRLEK